MIEPSFITLKNKEKTRNFVLKTRVLMKRAVFFEKDGVFERTEFLKTRVFMKRTEFLKKDGVFERTEFLKTRDFMKRTEFFEYISLV